MDMLLCCIHHPFTSLSLSFGGSLTNHLWHNQVFDNELAIVRWLVRPRGKYNIVKANKEKATTQKLHIRKNLLKYQKAQQKTKHTPF